MLLGDCAYFLFEDVNGLSAIDQLLDLFELSKMGVHLIPHKVKEFVKKSYHVGYHIAFVLIHEFVHQGKDILEK